MKQEFKVGDKVKVPDYSRRIKAHPNSSPLEELWGPKENLPFVYIIKINAGGIWLSFKPDNRYLDEATVRFHGELELWREPQVFKVGSVCKITALGHGHRFHINEKVTIVYYKHEYEIRAQSLERPDQQWWLGTDCLELITEEKQIQTKPIYVESKIDGLVKIFIDTYIHETTHATIKAVVNPEGLSGYISDIGGTFEVRSEGQAFTLPTQWDEAMKAAKAYAESLVPPKPKKISHTTQYAHLTIERGVVTVTSSGDKVSVLSLERIKNRFDSVNHTPSDSTYGVKLKDANFSIGCKEFTYKDLCIVLEKHNSTFA